MASRKAWREKLGHLFEQRQVADIQELATAVGRSPRTVLRYLKWAGYHNSYNHNGRFYTLATIPTFDEYGLWSHQDIWFSLYGALGETVAHQVDGSPAGMTCGQLQDRLHTRVNNQMKTFLEKGLLVLHKHGATYVYYSRHEATRMVQMTNREEMLKLQAGKMTSREKLLATRQSALRVIEILSAKLKHPDWGPDPIHRELISAGLEVSSQMVEATFEHFQISKKNSSFDR